MNERVRPSFGVTILTNSLIEDIWPKVVPLLEKGRIHWEDYYELDDLKLKCITGDMQLWVGIDREKDNTKVALMMLTALATYPRSIWLRYVYVGGEQLKKALYYRPQVTSWARAHGAVGEEITGRKGWEYMFPELKTKHNYVFLKKKFEES